MLGLGKLFSFNTKSSEQEEINKIFMYVKSIVVQEDLIKNIIQPLNQINSLKNDAKITAEIQVYLILEKCIITSGPDVVQKTYTRESLRGEIRKTFDIQKLPAQFRLIFLSEKEQLFLLSCSYTKVFSDYIATQIGFEEIQKILNPLTTNTIFANKDITDPNEAYVLSNIIAHTVPETTKEEITTIFKKINTALYQQIATSFGEKTALEIFQRHYQHIQETYLHSLAIPEDILDREQVSSITKEELEKQALKEKEEKAAHSD